MGWTDPLGQKHRQWSKAAPRSPAALAAGECHLLVENQKPTSGESGFCFPGEKIWSVWAIEQGAYTGKTQFVWPHLEPLFVQLLAVDLDLGLLYFRCAKGVEVFRHLFGGSFNASCIIAVEAGVGLIFASAATTTANGVDSVELYKLGVVANFDIDLSSIH